MTDNMVHYNFPSHTKGDTFNGVLFTITVNAVALDLTGAHIKMDLRLTPETTTVAKSFSDGSGITIDATPTKGKFTINAQVIDIAAANYYYDIQITLQSGSIKTYIGGRWNILQDVTYV
jgi:ribulose-5-phosphate 4-epimerase/fuculose-1-phosphate aldolase